MLFSVLFPKNSEFGRSPKFREQGTALDPASQPKELSSYEFWIFSKERRGASLKGERMTLIQTFWGTIMLD